MDNKQTAVEWLYDQIIIFPKTNNDLALNARSFNQAKAMEKEQIKEAYMICDDSGTLEESEVYAEQYYNRTYGQ